MGIFPRDIDGVSAATVSDIHPREGGGVGKERLFQHLPIDSTYTGKRRNGKRRVLYQYLPVDSAKRERGAMGREGLFQHLPVDSTYTGKKGGMGKEGFISVSAC